ncbi:hypothetical protein [Polycladidibacter stylochi]|uniref:hypothetical protein n=1 Tax=Polycladidibacter stylochi TaxID=1807766 RepID=UPI0008300FB5|nr:hypothetical protein [Pseudovibrio stylochi]
MIETVLYISLGFLTASILGLAALPFVWGRAVRLTRNALEAANPVTHSRATMARDYMRAQAAISEHKLNTRLRHTADKLALQRAQTGRAEAHAAEMQMEIKKLKQEIINAQQEIDNLKTQGGANKGRVRTLIDSLSKAPELQQETKSNEQENTPKAKPLKASPARKSKPHTADMSRRDRRAQESNNRRSKNNKKQLHPRNTKQPNTKVKAAASKKNTLANTKKTTDKAPKAKEKFENALATIRSRIQKARESFTLATQQTHTNRLEKIEPAAVEATIGTQKNNQPIKLEENESAQAQKTEVVTKASQQDANKGSVAKSTKIALTPPSDLTSTSIEAEELETSKGTDTPSLTAPVSSNEQPQQIMQEANDEEQQTAQKLEETSNLIKEIILVEGHDEKPIANHALHTAVQSTNDNAMDENLPTQLQAPASSPDSDENSTPTLAGTSDNNNAPALDDKQQPLGTQEEEKTELPAVAIELTELSEKQPTPEEDRIVREELKDLAAQLAVKALSANPDLEKKIDGIMNNINDLKKVGSRTSQSKRDHQDNLAQRIEKYRSKSAASGKK